MKKSAAAAFSSLLALITLTGSASAAIVIDSWSYQTLTSADLIGQQGVAAFNMSGGSASLGGVNFTTGNAGSPGSSSNGITETYSVPQVAWGSGASGAGFSNAVLNTFGYTGSNNGTVEFSGLTSGQQYTFQFILADARTGGADGRVVQISSSTVSGSTVTLGDTSGQYRYAYQGQDKYALISATFTADATGKAAFTPRTYAADGTTSAGTQINGINIIAVPEPSCALLGGVGMLGLLRRRRR